MPNGTGTLQTGMELMHLPTGDRMTDMLLACISRADDSDASFDVPWCICLFSRLTAQVIPALLTLLQKLYAMAAIGPNISL